MFFNELSSAETKSALNVAHSASSNKYYLGFQNSRTGKSGKIIEEDFTLVLCFYVVICNRIGFKNRDAATLVHFISSRVRRCLTYLEIRLLLLPAVF